MTALPTYDTSAADTASPGLRLGVYDSNWSAAFTISTKTPGSGLNPLNERFRIANDGNVGIGVYTPTAVLNLKAGTATASTAPLKFQTGVNLTTPEAGAVEYDGTNMYFTDSTAARRTLATVTSLGSYLPLAGGTMSGAVVLSAGTAAAPAVGVGATTLGLFNAGTNILGVSTAGVERLRVDASGNVGIGTTSPRASLEINGTGEILLQNSVSSIPGFLENTTSGSMYLSSNMNSTGAQINASRPSWRIGVSQTADQFVIRRSPAGSGALVDLFTVSFSGNVGIGTSTPTALLNLKAGTATASTAPLKFTSGVNLTTPEAGAIEYDGTNLYYTDSGAVRRTLSTSTNLGSSYLAIAGGTMTGAVISAAGTAAAPSVGVGATTLGLFNGGTDILGLTTAGTERMRIDASGNVGIGTVTPAQALDVNGVAKATRFFAGNGTFTAPSLTFGDTTSGFYSPSAGTINFTLGGVNSGQITNNKFTSYVPFNVSNGTAALPAYSFGGSLGTGMNSPVANTIGFSINGAEKIRIDASGKVGVGTTAPEEFTHHWTTNGTGLTYGLKLTNKSSSNAVGNATGILFDMGHTSDSANRGKGGIGYVFGSQNTWGRGDLYFMQNSVADASLATVSNAVMTITNAGNVGIGTTLPTAFLQVKAGTATANTAPLKFTSGVNLTTPEAGAVEYDGTNIYYTDSGAVRRTLATATNLGSSYLAIAGGTMTGAVVSSTGTAAAPSVGIGQTTSGLFSGGTNILGLSTSGAERMRINASGSVGIGTLAPFTTFEVKAPGTAAGLEYIADFAKSDANETGLYLLGGTSALQLSAGSKGVNPVDLTFAYQNSTGAVVEGMRLTNTGTVGVGVIAPQAALDVVSTGTSSAVIVPRATTANRPTTLVNGMIRYNTTTALFEFYQNGAWVNYTTVSDGRLKTNVIPVNQGLDIINQLNPVYFDWDQNNPRAQGFGNKHQVGFIAQEVEKVLPEVVNKGEDSYRSVEYGKIVSVVVAAVKELYSKVLGIDRELASVKTENAAKDKKIKELEQRLEKIEKALNSK